MIEATVINYLKEILNIPVYAEIPEKKPKNFVIVERIDSGDKDHIKAATLSVYSYGESLYDAASLDEDVKYAMKNMIILDIVSSCKLGGGGRNNDNANKLPRYESIFNVIFY